jgi:hypothetical protein
MKAHLPNWVEQIVPAGMTVHNSIVIKNQYGVVVAVFETYDLFIEFMEGLNKGERKLDEFIK